MMPPLAKNGIPVPPAKPLGSKPRAGLAPPTPPGANPPKPDPPIPANIRAMPMAMYWAIIFFAVSISALAMPCRKSANTSLADLVPAIISATPLVTSDAAASAAWPIAGYFCRISSSSRFCCSSTLNTAGSEAWRVRSCIMRWRSARISFRSCSALSRASASCCSFSRSSPSRMAAVSATPPSRAISSSIAFRLCSFSRCC